MNGAVVSDGHVHFDKALKTGLGNRCQIKQSLNFLIKTKNPEKSVCVLLWRCFSELLGCFAQFVFEIWPYYKT